MRLIIARHGNTFEKGDVIRRVGARTDLPLTAEGKVQTRTLGEHLRETYGVPDTLFTGELARLEESTKQIAAAFSPAPPILRDSRFNELDYGIHDGMEEEAFIQLVGKERLTAWNTRGVPLKEWDLSQERLFQVWEDFSDELKSGAYGETVLVVTSNGIARFAGGLTGDFSRFCEEHSLKLSTGGYGVFALTSERTWEVEKWNIRPTPPQEK